MVCCLAICIMRAGKGGMSCQLAVHECATWRSVGAASGKAVSDALYVSNADRYLNLAPREWAKVRSEADWAPNGRLVIHKALPPAGGTLGERMDPSASRLTWGAPGGRFAIVDALQGCLLAVIALAMRPGAGGLSRFGWHPSSGGVVHATRAWELGPSHVQKLQAAGMVVGSLPEAYIVTLSQDSQPALGPKLGRSFSPCGQFLLAFGMGSGRRGYVIFACRAQGLAYTFDTVHLFDSLAPYQTSHLAWLPVLGPPPRLVLRNNDGFMLVTVKGRGLSEKLKYGNPVYPGTCSPSGDCFIGERSLWLHLPSGKVRKLFSVPRLWAPQGCLLLTAGGIGPDHGPFTVLHYEGAFVEGQEEVWEHAETDPSPGSVWRHWLGL